MRTANAVPRPERRRRGQPPLRIGTALVASDLASAYLDFWPLARRAWSELVGIDSILVLVAERDDVPAELASDSSVVVYEPSRHLHTAFQAQCIRLLYPALVESDGAVVTSDVDMVPLSAGYFHGPARRVRATDFVAYRDVLLPIGQIPICYNAALPATWAELFGVRSLDDVRARLEAWGEGLEYDGTRGGRGWDTDQEILHRTLTRWGAGTHRAWILDDRATRFCRLERAELRKTGALGEAQERRVRRGWYSDYHALPSSGAFAALNERILELAGVATRG